MQQVVRDVSIGRIAIPLDVEIGDLRPLLEVNTRRLDAEEDITPWG